MRSPVVLEYDEHRNAKDWAVQSLFSSSVRENWMSYVAPLKDMRFVMHELAGLNDIQHLPGCHEATPDTVDAILEESAKFVQEVLAPLNAAADRNPGSYEHGVVKTAPGFVQAFKQFTEGGWQGLQHPPQYGGQGLPKLVAVACGEMLNAANLSFSLAPLLTDGVIEALMVAGTREQKERYIPKLIDGSWAGTMNLTEPQAGSDLAMVRTKAVRQADGDYRLFGTKIFITFGDHDLAENIVHMVLARVENAPAGVRGLSLFIVPKFLVQPDGSLGVRNDVWCQSLEHKLGIKASPTAMLLYGDNKGEVGAGAIGYLIGEEHHGLEYMFIMMNAARFAVGLQGVGLSDVAYQKALAYAKERIQSRPPDGSPDPVAIVHQPDVRRMLMTMRAYVEAGRAVAYGAAAALDTARHHPDSGVRARSQAFYEYMVPIVKGWCTETAVEVTSLGIQIHGGMGYIEETGAAQYFRDARILPIYEGTTAIQANDLAGRKTARDSAATAKSIIAAMRGTIAAMLNEKDPELTAIKTHFADAVYAYEEAAEFIAAHYKSEPRAVAAASVPYLKLAGIVHGGWQMARAALTARRYVEQGPDAFFKAKIGTARFYAEHILPQALALRVAIVDGGRSVLTVPVDQL